MSTPERVDEEVTQGAADSKPLTRKRPSRWRSELGPFVTLTIFAAALWVIDRLLAEYHVADIVRALTEVHARAVFASLVITAVGYGSLIAYDYVAFRFVGRPLGWRAMLVPSFVTFAFANSAPAPVVTAGGLRYRMYADAGLTAAEAASVAGFNVITYALGLCALSGLLLVARPFASAGALPPWLSISARTLGALLLAAVAAYFLFSARHRASISIGARELKFPSLRVALEQLAASGGDWILSSAALYVLLADVAHVGYLDFLTRFLVAQVAALVLPIPGGFGVFEAVVLLLTSVGAPAPRVLAALLVYRVVYYVLPLIIAGALAVRREVRRARERGTSRGTWLAESIVSAAPHLLAFATFASGLLLMLTGTIPADKQRLAWLADVLPLSIIEASHFLASVVGAALLIVAWGLERRIRAAYRVARILFGAGIVLSLLRSLDLRIAAVLAIALLVLTLAGRRFPRSGSLLREPLSPAWIVAIGAALVVTIYAATFAYHGTSYSTQLWWEFTLFGDAPRALRAAVGTSVLVLLFALAHWLARFAPRTTRRHAARE